MHHRNHQLDVPHSLSPNFLFSHLYSASITNNSFIPDSFVLTAETLIILHRTKNPLTEQAISFWLICTVIDRFRFEYFSIRSLQDIIRRSKADGDTSKDRKSTRLNS